MAINGYSNTDDFGFKDVMYLDNGFIVTMNGVQIEVDFLSDGDGDIYWFLK